MKKLLTILAIYFCFCTIGLAQIISIKEYNSKNELIKIEAPFILDINSMLSININKSILLDSMVNAIGEQNYPTELLEIINHTLRLQQQTLSNILMTGSRSVRLDALGQFRNAMSPLLEYFEAHQDELEETTLYKSLVQSLLEPENGYKPFFEVLNAHYKIVTDQYKEIVDKSSVRFSLGGWLNSGSGSTQFHIDGFDSITSTGIIEVPRFTTSIPPSEIKAYNAARDLADSLKSTTDDLVKQMKTRALDALQDLEKNVDEVIQNGISTFKTRIDSIDNNIRDKFNQPIDKFETSLNDYKVEIVRLVSALDNISFSQVLTIAQDVGALLEHTTELKNEAESIYQLVRTEVQQAPSVTTSLASDLSADISNVVTQLESIGKGYLNELKGTLDTFDESGMVDLQETAANFSASTFKLSYSQIPSHVDLDIRTTGQRKPGDQIYIKAVILGDDENNSFKQTVFWKKYTMFHSGIHSSVRASLIFANKINGDFDNATNDFQLAPSYSAIFKVGTKKSMFYNKYLTPGIGVNISALDFNNDNTPEIGIGFTAAFFQDYLQIGYGKNMSTDDNFWLFGLRLPLFGWAITGVHSAPSSTSIQGN